MFFIRTFIFFPIASGSYHGTGLMKKFKQRPMNLKRAENHRNFRGVLAIAPLAGSLLYFNFLRTRYGSVLEHTKKNY